MSSCRNFVRPLCCCHRDSASATGRHVELALSRIERARWWSPELGCVHPLLRVTSRPNRPPGGVSMPLAVLRLALMFALMFALMLH